MKVDDFEKHVADTIGSLAAAASGNGADLEAVKSAALKRIADAHLRRDPKKTRLAGKSPAPGSGVDKVDLTQSPG